MPEVVTIHQPEHLPWPGFFHKVAQADLLILLDTVQFRKNYFGNRNRLLGPNGPFWVTVPVRRRGLSSTPYREVRIAEDGRWGKRYRKSVFFHYRNHPWFEDTYPLIEEATGRTWERLADLNEFLILGMLRALGLGIPVVRASELGASGKSSELLLGLCRKVGARVYLAGALGRNYLDESLFREEGIEVRHNRYPEPPYPQHGRETFVPGLSALDLLMNCGPRSLPVLRRAPPAAAR